MSRGARQLSRVLVAIALVALLLRTIDLERVALAWRHPQWTYVILSVAVTFFLVALCVRRWQILLAAQGMQSRFGRLYILYLAGIFLNHLLPTSIGGDVLKAYQVGRDHQRMSRSAATVFVDRFLGLSVLVLLAIVLYMVRLRRLGETPIHAGFAVVVVGYGALLTALLWPRLVRWAAVHVLQGRFTKLFEVLDGWHDDVVSFRRHPGAIVHCLLLATLYHLLLVVHLFWILRIFTPMGSFSGVFTMLPGILLTGVVPISIGGIGVSEWAHLYFLNLMGVAAEVGVSVALFVRLKAVLLGAGGFLLFALLRDRLERPAEEPAPPGRAEDSPPRDSAPAPDTVSSIVAGDLCIRCGGCAAACPPEDVVTLDGDGRPHVEIARCIDCHLCLDVCPMKDLDIPALYRHYLGCDYDPERDGSLGHRVKAYVGYSTDPGIRDRGSSGGVAVQVMVSLLESGAIDAATTVLPDPERPYDFTARLARTREELLAGGGSKYTIVPANRVLRSFWKRGERVAFVGLPCQQQSLRLWERRNAKVRENVVLSVGLFCATTLRKEASRLLLDRSRVRPEEVERIDYRFGDWPGGVHALLKSGEIRPLHKLDVKYGAFNYLGKTYHLTECLNCVDFAAELCDISLGDPWLRGADGDYVYKGGWTLILTRTERGERYLREIAASGALYLEEIDEELLRANFTAQAEDKWNYAQWRIRRLRGRGRPAPEFHIAGPRWTLQRRLRAWRYASERVLGATELTRRLYIHTALSGPGVRISLFKAAVKRSVFRRRFAGRMERVRAKERT